MNTPQNWFITGVSAGFGREIAREALRQGHTVTGTLRKAEQCAAFEDEAPGRARAVLLDVTDPAQIERAVREAGATGGIDILVNNAGYGLLAALEETDDARLRQNLATNLIGPLLLMRAVIPIMRRQGGGHIINITAIAAFANELGFAVYGAAKAGVEAASDAVAGEVAPFGIKVTVVVPGPVRTDFIGRSLDPVPRRPEYAGTVGKFEAFLNRINGKQPGDPVKCAQAIVSIAGAPEPPARLLLGKYAHEKFAKKLAAHAAEMERWRGLGAPTDFSG